MKKRNFALQAKSLSSKKFKQEGIFENVRAEQKCTNYKEISEFTATHN